MSLSSVLRSAFGAALVMTVITACSESPGGPEVRCVSARVVDSQGNALGTVSLRAPVLLGSVVEKSSRVDDLELTLRATVDDVTLEVKGVSGFTKTVTLDEVEAGDFGGDSPLMAQGSSGAEYEITLGPGCS